LYEIFFPLLKDLFQPVPYFAYFWNISLHLINPSGVHRKFYVVFFPFLQA
jgi:hypothetical protein